ncbi:MAG: transposase [Magnetococcales bacterium]|nr:transposase [Magnetococcales bacterium]
MARIPRITVPGIPHHVTQYGNRGMTTFFGQEDYQVYLDLLRQFSSKAGTEIWGYCLMPNHLHLILMPSKKDGLRRALGETHRRYTSRINQRQKTRGHLWQERFHSYPVDEENLLLCARYVELNPVRSGLVKKAADWPWSSTKAHLLIHNQDVVQVKPLLERVDDWQRFLKKGLSSEELETLRRHSRTGHPLGSDDFFEMLRMKLGRDVKPRKRGRPKKSDG